MPQQPLTRITIILPISVLPSLNIATNRILDELALFCGGATISPTRPSSFFGLWVEDSEAEPRNIERADRLVITADCPLPREDPLLNAYLDYLKTRCQREFEEYVIWLTVEEIYRITTNDNVM